MSEFAQAVASEDLRTALEAVRDRIVKDLDEVDAEKSAPLYKQLSDVLVRLDGMPRKEASKLDDLAIKRAARLSAAPVAKRPARRRVNGGGD